MKNIFSKFVKKENLKKMPLTSTGFTCGTFDLLHAGHAIMLKECKNKCGFLIVGLQTDPSIDRKDKNKPVQELIERAEMLQAIEYVDQFFVYETEKQLYNILEDLNPDIRFLGSDWKGKNFTGYDLDIFCNFHNRNHSYSSTNLRNRVYEAEKEKRNVE